MIKSAKIRRLSEEYKLCKSEGEITLKKEKNVCEDKVSKQTNLIA